jgi:hypothetical protein
MEASSSFALQWINLLIVVVGVPIIAAALVAIGRKLQILDHLQGEVNSKMRPDLKDIRESFSVLEARAGVNKK